jgi:hypothetical protein
MTHSVETMATRLHFDLEASDPGFGSADAPRVPRHRVHFVVVVVLPLLGLIRPFGGACGPPF